MKAAKRLGRPPLPPPTDSPFRDEKEAAAFLRLQPYTLRKYRVKGVGPRYRKHGGHVVYDIRDLREWSDARARLSTSKTSTEGLGANPPR